MNLVDRAKNIILNPKGEWQAIAAEEPNIGQIFTGYVLPLALIPTIAHVLGMGLIGMGMLHSFTYGVAAGLVQFILAFIGVYLTAFVVDLLAPNFGSQKNLGRAVQLVAYSYTPAWVAGLLYIIPFLSWLAWLGSLYSLYLLYLGLPATMKTPEDKVVVYLIVTIVVLIVIYGIAFSILTAIFLGIFGLGMMSAASGM